MANAKPQKKNNGYQVGLKIHFQFEGLTKEQKNLNELKMFQESSGKIKKAEIFQRGTDKANKIPPCQ